MGRRRHFGRTSKRGHRQVFVVVAPIVTPANTVHGLEVIHLPLVAWPGAIAPCDVARLSILLTCPDALKARIYSAPVYLLNKNESLSGLNPLLGILVALLTSFYVLLVAAALLAGGARTLFRRALAGAARLRAAL